MTCGLGIYDPTWVLMANSSSKVGDVPGDVPDTKITGLASLMCFAFVAAFR